MAVIPDMEVGAEFLLCNDHAVLDVSKGITIALSLGSKVDKRMDIMIRSLSMMTWGRSASRAFRFLFCFQSQYWLRSRRAILGGC